MLLYGENIDYPYFFFFYVKSGYLSPYSCLKGENAPISRQIQNHSLVYVMPCILLASVKPKDDGIYFCVYHGNEVEGHL